MSVSDSNPLKWPLRFLQMAGNMASWSKETTKVGAIARDSESRAILETGYNGIPRGVNDLPERMSVKPEKYLWVSHAEENLVAHAARKVLEGSVVTVTHLCCCRCARLLINAGVSRVEYGAGKTSMPQEEFDIAVTMFSEAGVEIVRLEP